jgi:YHS domain-containing protein
MLFVLLWSIGGRKARKIRQLKQPARGRPPGRTRKRKGMANICPVCQMDVDPATAPKSAYKGKSYYFCMQNHKNIFDATPDKFVTADKS